MWSARSVSIVIQMMGGASARAAVGRAIAPSAEWDGPPRAAAATTANGANHAMTTRRVLVTGLVTGTRETRGRSRGQAATSASATGTGGARGIADVVTRSLAAITSAGTYAVRSTVGAPRRGSPSPIERAVQATPAATAAAKSTRPPSLVAPAVH